jgi:hypothetical protein
MAYTDIDKPSDYFNTKLYTGNGGTQSITGVGFQPNMTWIKGRSFADNHFITDSVRGVTKTIFPDLTAAEETQSGALTAFGSDGFSVGSMAEGNTNGATICSWNWKAGTSFTNDASGTGIGTIDSTGSVNQDAGFSIVSWTGDGNTSGTIKHGLSTAPAMIISKNRDGAENWFCYHKSLGATKYIRLNITNAAGSATSIWNDTEPTTSVFTVGNDTSVNSNNVKYIAYCFSEKQGYSKFGSYTGNGNADGTFVYTGFAPAFFILKRTDATEQWLIKDNKRPSYNPNNTLYANLTNAEDTSSSVYGDFVSNGVKLRGTYNGMNASGASYIYMAFAENPFVTSTGVPATAR